MLMPIFSPLGTPSVLTLLGSTTGTSSITLPSGIQNGDLGVLVEGGMQAANLWPSSTAPSGWTRQQFVRNTLPGEAEFSSGAAIFTKLLSASDSGATLDVDSGGVADRAMALVFRPDFPATALEVVGTSGSAVIGSSTNTSISAFAGGPAVNIAVYWAWTDTTTTRGNTQGQTDEIAYTSTHGLWVRYLVGLTPASSGTVSISNVDSVRSVVASLALAIT